MRYENIVKAQFLSRPNRFIAHCIVDGAKETVHVKNTGRCKELLTENATVYLVKKCARFCRDYGKDAMISQNAPVDCSEKQNEIMFDKPLVWDRKVWYTNM